MRIQSTPEEARAILDVMLDVASRDGAATDADKASIAAAGRYVFDLPAPVDVDGLKRATPQQLASALSRPELKEEAVRFATVMAFVDGKVDDAKIDRVLAYASALGTSEDYVNDLSEVVGGRMKDVLGQMIRANMLSVTGKPWASDDILPWFLPYRAKPDPALTQRFEGLGGLAEGTFGPRLPRFL